MKGLKMTNEDREEMYQDMLEESRREEYFEHKIRNDYDYFEEHFQDDIAILVEAINNVKNLYDEYGYEFEVKDFEGL